MTKGETQITIKIERHEDGYCVSDDGDLFDSAAYFDEDQLAEVEAEAEGMLDAYKEEGIPARIINLVT